MVQTPPLHKGVALGPKGSVVSVAARRLLRHAPRDGRTVAEVEACFTFFDAFVFLNAERGALVCEDGLRIYRLDDFGYLGIRRFDRKARAAAFSPTRMVVAFDEGPLELIDIGKLDAGRSIPVGGEVSALALSDDGSRLAVGFDGGDVLLRDLKQGSTATSGTRFTAKRMLEVTALAFSPDASRLFVAAGRHAAVWRTAAVGAGKRPERVFGVVSGAHAARWVSASEVAITGRDGLLLLRMSDGAAGSLPGGFPASSQPLGLALSSDRRRLCAGDASGRLVCYARGRQAMPGAVPLMPRGDSRTTMGGRVQFHGGPKRKQLQLKAHPRMPLPRVGARVALLKYVETHAGALTSVRWQEVAKASVDAVNGDVVKLTIESSSIALDAEPDPLVYDTAVKLAW
jgi:hypothetical protein